MAYEKLSIILEYRGMAGEGLHAKPIIAVRVEEIPDSEEVISGDIDAALDIAKGIIIDNWLDDIAADETGNSELETSFNAVFRGEAP